MKMKPKKFRSISITVSCTGLEIRDKKQQNDSYMRNDVQIEFYGNSALFDDIIKLNRILLRNVHLWKSKHKMEQLG